MPITQNLWIGELGEVIAGEPVTSELYPVSVGPEDLDIQHSLVEAELLNWPLESIDVGHTFSAGSLVQPLKQYTDWPPEQLDIQHTLADASLVVVLKTYEDWPPESIDIAHTLADGTLTVVLKTYADWPVEDIDVSHTFTAGVLT